MGCFRWERASVLPHDVDWLISPPAGQREGCDILVDFQRTDRCGDRIEGSLQRYTLGRLRLAVVSVWMMRMAESTMFWLADMHHPASLMVCRRGS